METIAILTLGDDELEQTTGGELFFAEGMCQLNLDFWWFTPSTATASFDGYVTVQGN